MSPLKTPILAAVGGIVLSVISFYGYFKYFLLPPKNLDNNLLINTTKIEVECHYSKEYSKVITNKKIILNVISNLSFKRKNQILFSAGTSDCFIKFFTDNSKKHTMLENGEIKFDRSEEILRKYKYNYVYEAELSKEVQEILF